MDINSDSVKEALDFLSKVTNNIKNAINYINEGSNNLNSKISNPYGNLKELLKKIDYRARIYK